MKNFDMVEVRDSYRFVIVLKNCISNGRILEDARFCVLCGMVDSEIFGFTVGTVEQEKIRSEGNVNESNRIYSQTK